MTETSESKAPEAGGVRLGPDVRAAAPGSTAYRLQNVGVTLPSARGPIAILQDVSFTAETGTFVSVVGQSGTGKTTLLRLLGGLLQPTAGTVHLEGTAVAGPPDRVVTVFQDYTNALLPWRTVVRNVELPLEGHLSRTERRERALTALDLVGLTPKADDFPWRLSGGMQQRVQIARALALRPKVLLMDEPFGALDAMTRANLQDQLLRLQAETGATVVFITHDLDEAIYLSDTVMVIAGTSPSTVTGTFDIDLPRPRNQFDTRSSPRYLALRQRVADQIGLGHVQ